MSKAWMPLYVGDYLGDTAHLTQGQHGAYFLLLMHYWQRGFIPAEQEQCFCIARAMDDQSRSNVSAVLSEFFQLKEGKYRQARLDVELEKAEKSYNRRAGAALRRWEGVRNKNNADALHKHSYSNPSDCDSDSSSAVDVDLNQDIENQIREIASLHPKVKDAFHLSSEIAHLIGEAISRHGRDVVWAGTKCYQQAVNGWPVAERQMAASPQKFFRESQYLTDPREWERGSNGNSKIKAESRPSAAVARSDRLQDSITAGVSRELSRRIETDGTKREDGRRRVSSI